MSLYQQAMLQALGIQQYVERLSTSHEDPVAISEIKKSGPPASDVEATVIALKELAPQQLPPQKTYPQVPELLIRDIQIALELDVSVKFGTEMIVTDTLVTLPYPFSTSDKPMLLKALHGKA